MTLSNRLVLASWLLILVFWVLASLRVKRSVGSRPGAWSLELALRLVIVALVVAVLKVPGLRLALRHAQSWMNQRGILEMAGALVCVLGAGMAVWARATLGKNWGLPMSRKQEPELVTTGPYARVRHPIYGGLLLSMAGSALGGNLFWAIPFVGFGAYFLFCIRREEKLMTGLFPEQYPAYRKRTKRLVPFLL